MSQQQQQQQLTSTTAPGKIFASRSEMAEHYKSDWHKYNLKRRQAGLPVLLQADFEARLKAAQAMRAEQTKQKTGKDHLKNKNKQQSSGKMKHKKNQKGSASAHQLYASSQAAAYDRIKEQNENKQVVDEAECEAPQDEKLETQQQTKDTPEAETPNQPMEKVEQDEQEAVMEQVVEIDPRQCLFDRHYSTTVQANVTRMQRKYGFFVPDQEYLVDLEGLIGYCHEKIQLGRLCLYCQKGGFHSAADVQRHMISKSHTKLLYEADVDLPDLDVFYDFSQANQEFWNNNNNNNNKREDFEMVQRDDDEMNENDEDDDGEWEDISDDEEMGSADANQDDEDVDDDDDDDIYDGFEQEVARMGLDVTPLGELIFPDGRIIGHRSLRRYYKQRAPSQRPSNVSVLAARKAAGERLYRGQVYNIGYADAPASAAGGGTDSAAASSNTLALTKAGITPGLAAGRAGKGILVPSGSGTFSQLSIYRYRAAVRKQRRGEFKGQQLHNKTSQNINRMDKKHNRLMNGVSVAHAAR